MKPFTLVEVEWVDASCIPPWDTVDFAKLGKELLATCTTIGYYIRQDKDVMVLAATHIGKERVAGWWVIQRANVKKVRCLRG